MEVTEFDRIFDRMMGRFPFGSPVWYGYEIVAGPGDGPRARDAGNCGCDTCGPNREVQVDTIVDEKNGKIKMVAEIPGVEKKDITVTLQDREVVIDAARDQTRYGARVPLRQGVNRDSVGATYRNGILEITFGIRSRPKGKTVRVD